LRFVFDLPDEVEDLDKIIISFEEHCKKITEKTKIV